MKNSAFFAYNKDFVLFGTQHLLVLAIMVFICFALPYFAKRYLNPTQQLWLSRGMAITIAFWTAAYIVILIWLGKFNYRTDLPFDLCNFMGLLLPIAMWRPSYRIHEVLYFWIFAGTLQAVLTPHLFNGFPNFIFIKYWFVHGGLIVYAVYITRVFDLKPTKKSIWRSFLYLQAYVAFVMIINLVLDSNYVYVLHKPPTASVLDFLGPWPWYVLVCELGGLLIFFLAWLPLKFSKKNTSKI